jgi:hypothetical protein
VAVSDENLHLWFLWREMREHSTAIYSVDEIAIENM